MSDRPDITRASDERTAEAPFTAHLTKPSAYRRTIQLNSPHSAKFRLVTGFLLGIGVAALALAVALASNAGSNGQMPAWSSWKPSAAGRAGAAEIASHVAPNYRLTPSTQLDVVTLVNLANTSTQATGTSSGLTVAVNAGAPGGTPALSLLSGNTIAYNLCGTGGQSNCELPGAATPARLLLLRREALELALYTFKYEGGVSNVICVLPPSHSLISSLSSRLPSAKSLASSSKPVSVAVLFLRSELQPWLGLPLSSTLQTFPPSMAELPAWQNTSEADLVSQITARGLFSEQIESEQTGGNLLVLNQLPPQ
ncbi:MAG TPA: hypothetical protein VG405_07760, partial [Solirubrobacteraceae bacterium]|jgi:hypothetical protein|nr:hypothetical protein [Solirubrobacteraceae bacterium]